MRAILTYHSLDETGSPISVSPDAFRAHLAFLASGRIRVVPLAQLASVSPASDAVAITFDDGFVNCAQVAAPLLSELGLPATVFVVADHAGKDNAWGGVAAGGVPTLPLMTWEALGTLAGQGFEIGAHTRRHPDLRLVRGAALEDEVAGCVECVAARLGVRPSSFAYPYGRWSGAALMAVRDVYERAVTTELRTLGADEDPVQLPRLDMYYFRGSGQLEAWGSAAFRRRLWLRAKGRRVREMMQQASGTHAA